MVYGNRLYEIEIIPFDELTHESICGIAGFQKPVSFWAPRRVEIQRIVDLVKLISKKDKPLIVDMACGNGLLSYLIAKSGEVKVKAFDPNKELLEKTSYTHDNLEYIVANSDQAISILEDIDVDLVFNSWMPLDVNLTPDIRRINPKGIVYVKHLSGATGVSVEKYLDFILDDESNHSWLNIDFPRKEYVSYEPGEEYTRNFYWRGPTHTSIKMAATEYDNTSFFRHHSELWNNYDYSTELNEVEIQLRKDVMVKSFPNSIVDESKKYVWENILELIRPEVNRVRLIDENYTGYVDID